MLASFRLASVAGRLLRPALCFGLVALFAAAGCRRGGGALVGDTEPAVEPYPGFFQARLGNDIYLFADILEKLRFDVDPASLTYEQFISRAGQRVFIANERADVVPRIAVGFEQAVDTQLTPVTSPGAPPADTPPPTTTRRAVPEETPDGPTTVVTTRPTTGPGATTLPADRRGPIGDPPPRPDPE